MPRLRTTLLGAIGIALGIVTLRKYRQRRRDPREEAEVAARDAVEEAAQALEHSAASIDHARTAGEKAIETASEELEQVRGTVSSNDQPTRGRRLRQVVRRRGRQ